MGLVKIGQQLGRLCEFSAMGQSKMRARGGGGPNSQKIYRHNMYMIPYTIHGHLPGYHTVASFV